MNETFKARKLWGGYVSVPDCIVKYAIRTHKKVRVEFEGQYMMIDKDSKYEITAPPQTAHRTDKYIKSGQTYYLWDYWWSPVEEIRPQEYNVAGLTKLHDIMKNFFKPKPKQLELDNKK